MIDFRVRLYFFQTITVLELNSNKIQDKGIENLADVIIKNKTLKTLSLTNNPSVLGVVLEQIELKKLQIWGKRIRINGAKYIGLSLQNNTTITALDLRDCDIGVEGVKYLADALHYNKVLIEIDLMGNQIGSTGAQYLADVLRQYPTLVRLRLEDNQIDDQGAQYLACVLENNIVNINNYFALISYSFIIDT
ncbi:unnamed protein product [Rotaria sp. Silwood2]|nr:unnamed protein product [Rotaria sp. Silwood2]